MAPALALPPSLSDGLGWALVLVGLLLLAQALAQLQRANRRLATLAAIVESADDAVLAADLSGQITTWNRGAERLFGYPAESILGCPLNLLCPPERLDELELNLTRVSQGKNVTGLETIRLRADGTPVEVSLTITPLRQKNGQVLGAAAIVREVSELRKAARQLEARVAERTAELAAANRELEAFIYSVSHDLRAPLRSLDGYTMLLAEECADQLSEPASRYLSCLRDGTQQMTRMLQDLLAFSQLHRHTLNRSRLDMTAAARAAWDTLRPQWADREVDFILPPLPDCQGDSTLISQVWTNLLSNALKYTSRQSRARVEVGSSGAEYWVRDNGTGFDMRYAHKLFRVFQRLHGEEYEGTGVGLAIVDRIVSRHGGRVWGTSVPGEGATFSFTVG